MSESQHLEQLLDSDVRLVAIETGHVDRLIGLFKRLALTTGRAVYEWSPTEGIYRLGYEHIVVPRTQRPYDALDYIAGSLHFGIYVMRDFGDALEDARNVALIRSIVANPDNAQRLVLLMDNPSALPAELRPYTVRVKHAWRKAS